MKNNTKAILLIILGIILIIFAMQALNTNIPFAIIQVIASIIIFFDASRISKKDENKKGNEESLEVKKEENFTKCKYCNEKISEEAKFCPHCRKAQSVSLTRITLGIILGVIILLFYFSTNNDSPLEIRKFICGIGLRKDYPYCYYIEVGK